MAEIVAFPTDDTLSSDQDLDATSAESFLLKEGLELLADYRAISDEGVRASLRALTKSLARPSAQASSS